MFAGSHSQCSLAVDVQWQSQSMFVGSHCRCSLAVNVRWQSIFVGSHSQCSLAVTVNVLWQSQSMFIGSHIQCSLAVSVRWQSQPVFTSSVRGSDSHFWLAVTVNVRWQSQSMFVVSHSQCSLSVSHCSLAVSVYVYLNSWSPSIDGPISLHEIQGEDRITSIPSFKRNWWDTLFSSDVFPFTYLQKCCTQFSTLPSGQFVFWQLRFQQ